MRDFVPYVSVLLIAVMITGVTLYGLSRLTSPAGRLVVAIFAGLLTYWTVGWALSLTQTTTLGQLFYHYHDLFSVRDRIPSFFARIFDWPLWSDDDEFYGPHQRLIANIVEVGFWTLVFGGLYFYFVCRRTERSNQMLQPTASPRE